MMNWVLRGSALMLLGAALSASASAAGSVDAHGIVDWNSSTATLNKGGVGISAVNRIGDGQIEVVFSASGYKSLESTVIVSCRSSLPCFVAWDTFNANSVRVRTWGANSAPAPSGSFSIALVQGPAPRPNARGGSKN
jgi:hypothetical protein